MCVLSIKHEVKFIDTGRKDKQNKAILKPLVVIDYNQTKMVFDD